MEMWLIVALGLVIRLCLTVYGEWQDRTMAVKYTDIDYHVFHDATQYMAQGQSPYMRSTYRYTPLLSAMLLPNIWISPVFGKLLFIVFDVLTGYLLYQITLANTQSPTNAKVCCALWLFNPLPMAVSSRGNAESIMSFLVLLCLKLLKDDKIIQAGVTYAISIHMKIYPVTYALPIYLWLGDWKGKANSTDHSSKNMLAWIMSMMPTRNRMKFILPSVLTLTTLTAVFYYCYGWEFLEHTYLYHITRKDIRHNFSPYFYMLYLQSGADNSVILGLLAFLPQVLLLLVFSMQFYRDLPLAFFLNTMAFVTFNKVCTSQYFLWYLCLLPLLLPNLTHMSKVKATSTTLLWFIGQAVWLLPAYYLEFEGRNTFLYIWSAGLVFFLINCYIIYVVIHHYSPTKNQVARQHTQKETIKHNQREVKAVKHTSIYQSAERTVRTLMSDKQENNYNGVQTRSRSKNSGRNN